jgi:hypothetical protein
VYFSGFKLNPTKEFKMNTQSNETANVTEEFIMLEYMTKDESGETITEYGEVSTNDIKEMDGYELPVHRSLWS